MSTWRSAGLSYVHYSTIAARMLRKSLKSNLREEASKRDISQLKFMFWAEGNPLPVGERPKGEPAKPG